MNFTPHISIRKSILSIVLLLGIFTIKAAPPRNINPTSTTADARKYLLGVRSVRPSLHWPNVNPKKFFENVQLNIDEPLGMYAGKGTNFCGYGALAYLLLQDDPLGYAKLMIHLFDSGHAVMGNAILSPSSAVKKAAGVLKYKGILDIRPAEQMFYLSLADHFKGYVNIFNLKYDAGDEDLFWASVNYAKFNRMIRRTLKYEVDARGSDLIHPSVKNTYDHIENKLSKGIVVLYLNNRILHRKKHEKIKLGIPTHFVILEKIMKADGMVTLVYWDYGRRTLLQIKPKFLRKIVFGISLCTKPAKNEK